uniref:Uncharacterized protein n=1 Tax=Candidatus Kentrum sp. LFY TaxID=2126342 RepID=A0A450V7N9_9GAMM|nr:MAG: hypothetical protein BECKLFY1418A_GA0070994_11275 [Candidatus Kentron sp. LFY]
MPSRCLRSSGRKLLDERHQALIQGIVDLQKHGFHWKNRIFHHPAKDYEISSSLSANLVRRRMEGTFLTAMVNALV